MFCHKVKSFHSGEEKPVNHIVEVSFRWTIDLHIFPQFFQRHPDQEYVLMPYDSSPNGLISY